MFVVPFLIVDKVSAPSQNFPKTTTMDDIPTVRSRRKSTVTDDFLERNVFRKVFISLDEPPTTLAQASAPVNMGGHRPLNPIILEQLLSVDTDESLAESLGSRKITFQLGPFRVDEELLICEFDAATSLSDHGGGGGGRALSRRSTFSSTTGEYTVTKTAESTLELHQDPSTSKNLECIVSWGRFRLYDHDLAKARGLVPEPLVITEEEEDDDNDNDDEDDDPAYRESHPDIQKHYLDERVQRSHFEITKGKGGIFTRIHYHSKPWIEILNADAASSDLFVLLWLETVPRGEKSGGLGGTLSRKRRESVVASTTTTPIAPISTDCHFGVKHEPKDGVTYKQLPASELPTEPADWITPTLALMLEALQAEKAVLVLYPQSAIATATTTATTTTTTTMKDTPSPLEKFLKVLHHQKRITLCHEWEPVWNFLTGKPSPCAKIHKPADSPLFPFPFKARSVTDLIALTGKHHQ